MNEINPLGVNTQGELMALDGKITINSHALSRQPIINTLNLSEYQKEHHPNPVGWHWLDWNNRAGKIATVCNSFDLALLTWDLLNQNRINPACGVVIDDNFTDQEQSPQLYCDRLRQILAELTSTKKLKVILINIWETETASNEILQTVVDYVQSTSELDLSSSPEKSNLSIKSANRDRLQNSLEKELSPSQPKFVVRLLAEKDLTLDTGDESIHLSSSLENAVAKAISIVKSN
ncbi:MAG: hypothetical protein ACFCAD_15030 [Pleurocapsa sp.]